MGSVSPRELQPNFLGKKRTHFYNVFFPEAEQDSSVESSSFSSLRVFLCCRSWEKRIFEYTWLRAACGPC